MALPRGFEPPTCPLGGGRAIQLCHESEFLYGTELSIKVNRKFHFLHLFVHYVTNLDAVG